MQGDGSANALVIVHLSSLDSFAWHVGMTEANALACALCGAISAYADTIVVLDQRWPLSRYSGPRLSVLTALQGATASVRWFGHDEQDEGWDEPMSRLGQLLRAQRVGTVTLAGLEAWPDGFSGCVNETRRHLAAQGFVCSVEAALCGWYGREPDETPQAGKAEVA